MASERALALRRATVENKLLALAERVNTASAAPLPAPGFSRQPEIAAVERLEWLADLLDTQAGQLASLEQQLAETTAVAEGLQGKAPAPLPLPDTAQGGGA